MAVGRTLQDLFKRYRRPGDLVFAVAFLVFAAFLASQIGSQTKWANGTKLFAQPAFWPSLSLYLMLGFALLHLAGSLSSPRILGRWAEIGFWARSLEYAVWFIAYVFMVPYAGYLISTIAFSTLLTFRAGYRSMKMLGAAVLVSVIIVLIFKSFLQVKIPGGMVYEMLPAGLRGFMLTYL